MLEAQKLESLGPPTIFRTHSCDDFVVSFQYRQDAEDFQKQLRERFARFNLELAEEKTRLLLFGRFAATKRTKYASPRHLGLYFFSNQRSSDLPISSGIAESAVNQVVSARFAKKRQMRWSDQGAHLLAQIRVQLLNGELRPRAGRYLSGTRNLKLTHNWMRYSWQRSPHFCPLSRHFYKKLRMARISADELHRLIDEGQRPVIVDLRTSVVRDEDSPLIPGALVMDFAEADRWLDRLPTDRQIIFYCTCPSEVGPFASRGS